MNRGGDAESRSVKVYSVQASKATSCVLQVSEEFLLQICIGKPGEKNCLLFSLIVINS